MSEAQGNDQTVSYNTADEIKLLDFIIVLARNKKLVIGLPALAAALSIVISLLMSNIYSGTTKILVPQQTAGVASALLGQLQGEALAGFASSALGLKNPSELYIGILKSRTLLDALIQRFNLKKHYKKELMSDTREALLSATKISTGRDGIITIEVEDNTAEIAADIANAYVTELDNLLQTLSISESAQRVQFLKTELSQTKNRLNEAEERFRKMQETTGLIQLEEQGKAIIEGTAHLKAQIASNEIQLVSMRNFMTPNNPDYQRTLNDLLAMKSQLKKAEQTANHNHGDGLLPAGKLPEKGVEYLRRLRELKYQESLFNAISAQHEMARIDATKDAVVIKVIDEALPADKKSGPKRAQIVILSTIAATIIAVLVTLAKTVASRPERAKQLVLLRAALRWH